MGAVSLEKVYKRFGDNVVVKDVNLTIESGDFMVLVGPSGCGKSTTLRMIAGLESLSDGTLKIGGKVVNHLSPRDRDVAMVFQSYALYPHMTVAENMSFGLQLRKMPKAEIASRVKDAAEILELGTLLERKPKQLSGGQRQRVAMGRAIVRQPAVFLFDEPLSNLDAKLRVQMRAEIAKLQRRLGTTMVYVTHDQVEAMTLAKHVVVMNAGMVMQVGEPLELYRAPKNVFVAGFIGSPAMNFFDVELAGEKLEGKGFSLVLPERFRTVARAGQPLVMGIRPEHVREAADGVLALEVEVLEPLGVEVHALGTVEKQAFVARLEPDTQVKVGSVVHLAIEHANVHLFDRQSGVSLLSGPPS